MAKNQSRKSAFLLIPALMVLACGGLLLVGGGFAFAATQEQHDSFCASCHTQPESTFYQRSTAGQPTDMASFHTTKNVNCIDCHSGSGVTGRMSAELLGARNAMLWYSGTAVQPAKLTLPIADANCIKCHQQTVTNQGQNGGEGEGREGGSGHWHFFLARWQSRDPNAGSCVSCHPGHNTQVAFQGNLQGQPSVRAVCQACHQVLRREGD